jgi:hypothetical protein
VVLTREAGKNAKLLAMLAARGVPAMELPLVETAPGPDREALPGTLRAGGFDWAVITSPEAAAVFLEGWRTAQRPQVSPRAPMVRRDWSREACRRPVFFLVGAFWTSRLGLWQGSGVSVQEDAHLVRHMSRWLVPLKLTEPQFAVRRLLAPWGACNA